MSLRNLEFIMIIFSEEEFIVTSVYARVLHELILKTHNKSLILVSQANFSQHLILFHNQYITLMKLTLVNIELGQYYG